MIGLALTGLVLWTAPTDAYTPVDPDAQPPALLNDAIDHRKVAKALSIVHRDAPCSPCWGALVDYTTFTKPVQSYRAKRFDGFYVTVLLPVENPREHLVTDRHLRALVDRLDILYLAYRDLMGWEPVQSRDPAGKQVFAILPNDPNFIGMGRIAGDSSEYSNSVLEDPELDVDILPYVWSHELAHNFDPIDHWDYGYDELHAWTTFIDSWFLRKQSRYTVTSDWHWSHYYQQAIDQWESLVALPTFSWSRCLANPIPQWDCGYVWAHFHHIGSFMVSLSSYMKPTEVRDWVRQGVQESRQGLLVANTSEARNDAMLAGLAAATRSDPSCLNQIFPWGAGPGVHANGRFELAFRPCRDEDGDGFIRRDDCDDSRADVNPLAIERVNGLDDNCNVLVDDVSIAELDQAGGDFSDAVFDPPNLVDVPFHASGTLSGETDVDTIGLHVPAALTGFICSQGGPLVFFSVYAHGGEYTNDYSIPAGGCLSMSNANPMSAFGVRGQAGSHGSYTLRLVKHRERTMLSTRALHLEYRGDTVQGIVDASRLDSEPESIQVRWFASGAGLIGDRPLSDPEALISPPIPEELLSNPSYPVQVRAQLWRDEMPIGEPSFPLTVNRPSYALSNGTAETFRLDAGQELRKLFVDVPVGAQSLLVTGQSAGEMEVRLVRVPAPATPWPDANIAISPDPVLASHRFTTRNGDQQGALIVGPTLEPGRWYVVANNQGAMAADLTLMATVTAAAPEVRSGSYFNPSRSGHGVFVYPAGDQWSALWYTYFRDFSPTWYYAQGPAPGADGIWSAPLYRSHWSQGTSTLHEVGNVILTPTGRDAFTWTFNLEGDTGSEPMQSLGRGCLESSGGILDSSGNWFDPERSGSGYSVQTWENGYVYVASFIYDAKGFPRFASAETLTPYLATIDSGVRQTAGPCPLCLAQPKLAPLLQVRSAGVTEFDFSSGTLGSVFSDIGFVGNVEGSWTSFDQVQPLGEIQGCEL